MSKYKVGDKFVVEIKEQFENTDGSKFFKLKGLEKVLLSEAELDKIWEDEPDEFERGYKAGMKDMLLKLANTGTAYMDSYKKNSKAVDKVTPADKAREEFFSIWKCM